MKALMSFFLKADNQHDIQNPIVVHSTDMLHGVQNHMPETAMQE